MSGFRGCLDRERDSPMLARIRAAWKIQPIENESGAILFHKRSRNQSPTALQTCSVAYAAEVESEHQAEEIRSGGGAGRNVCRGVWAAGYADNGKPVTTRRNAQRLA